MKEINILMNKILLIGITILDEKDELIKQIQVHGPIIKIDADGIFIKNNETGNDFAIPPDFEHINEAQPGNYTLRSTGEVVINPDYISSWTLRCGSNDKIESYSKNGFTGYVPQ